MKALLPLRSSLVAAAGIMLLTVSGCGTSTSASSSAAAVVNGQTVTLSSYHQQVAVERAQQQQQVGFDACATRGMGVLCNQWKHDALTTLIDNELVHQYAQSHHIAYTKSEEQQNWKAVFHNRFGTQAVLNTFLKVNHETYGYLRASVDADLLRSKLLYPITKNMSSITPAVALGVVELHTHKSLVLAQKLIKQGLTFQGVIGDMNGQKDACIPGGCTELGWIPFPFLPAELKAVKTARIGSVVGPIVHQQDWELYKVWNRTQRFQLNATQQYQRRSQLFNQWLKAQERKASIKRYVAV